MEHVDYIVPAASRLAVVVKHPIQLVAHRLCRSPGSWCHDFWKDKKDFLALASTKKTKGKELYLVGFRTPARIEQAC
jgi:hypothetical protein